MCFLIETVKKRKTCTDYTGQWIPQWIPACMNHASALYPKPGFMEAKLRLISKFK